MYIAVYVCAAGQSLLLAVSIVAMLLQPKWSVCINNYITDVIFVHKYMWMQLYTQTHTQGPQTQSLQPSCTNMDTQALTQTDTIHTQTHTDTHTHTHNTHTHTQHEEGSSLVHHTTHMYTLGHAMYVPFYECTHRQSVT